MRNTLIAATVVALLVCGWAITNLQAQQGGPSAPAGAPPQGVAVIDIGLVLDNYYRLKQDMTTFKNEFDNKKKVFDGELQAIEQQKGKLNSMNKGTKEFKDLEEATAKRYSDLQVDTQLADKEMNTRWAAKHFDAYRDVCNEVKRFATANRIAVVLRLHGAKPDPNDPNSVRAELSKIVMYYDTSIDITDAININMNRGAAKPPAGAPANPPSAANRGVAAPPSQQKAIR